MPEPGVQKEAQVDPVLDLLVASPGADLPGQVEERDDRRERPGGVSPKAHTLEDASGAEIAEEQRGAVVDPEEREVLVPAPDERAQPVAFVSPVEVGEAGSVGGHHRIGRKAEIAGFAQMVAQ